MSTTLANGNHRTRSRGIAKRTPHLARGTKLEARARARARARRKTGTRHCYDCDDQGHIKANCTSKWANNLDEKEGQDEQTPS